MKIRIKENSVRYRLAKSEVTALARNEKLEETTEFPIGSLKYAIEPADIENLSIDFSQSKITLHVPQTLLQHWATTDQVGMEYHLPLSNNNSLYLLIEKDFKCIDGDLTEDQSDFFENPNFTC